ncbi:UNVERIFIED_ORG: hypothetical protein ABIB63_001502 [Xanthomonas axonopodis]
MQFFRRVRKRATVTVALSFHTLVRDRAQTVDQEASRGGQVPGS